MRLGSCMAVAVARIQPLARRFYKSLGGAIKKKKKKKKATHPCTIMSLQENAVLEPIPASCTQILFKLTSQYTWPQFFRFVFFFLGLHPRQMEVPRLGV